MPQTHPDADIARMNRYNQELLERLEAECERAEEVDASHAEKTLHRSMQDIHRCARSQLKKAMESEEGLDLLARYRSHRVLCHFDLLADLAYEIACANGEAPRLLANPVTLRLMTRHIRPYMDIAEMQQVARGLVDDDDPLPTGIIRSRNYIMTGKVALGDIDQGRTVFWDHGTSLIIPRRIGEIALGAAIGARLDDQIHMPILNGLGLNIQKITVATTGSTAMVIATDAEEHLFEL